MTPPVLPAGGGAAPKFSQTDSDDRDNDARANDGVLLLFDRGHHRDEDVQAAAARRHLHVLAVLRDLAGSSYVRQERDGLLVGPYEEERGVYGRSM